MLGTYSITLEEKPKHDVHIDFRIIFDTVCLYTHICSIDSGAIKARFGDWEEGTQK